MSTVPTPSDYPARLDVDRPGELSRVTSFFRLFMVLPIAVLMTLLTASTTRRLYDENGQAVSSASGSIIGGLFAATALMIVFRRRYPRWWFDFAVELTRFGARIGAYLTLLTDTYPSTTDEQAVHLEVDYPDVDRDLNRWLPLVKWLLVLPHLVILVALSVVAVFAVFVAWVAILFTGRYPDALFDFVVGVGRWALRVQAYATLLVTDRYPPFSLT